MLQVEKLRDSSQSLNATGSCLSTHGSFSNLFYQECHPTSGLSYPASTRAAFPTPLLVNDNKQSYPGVPPSFSFGLDTSLSERSPSSSCTPKHAPPPPPPPPSSVRRRPPPPPSLRLSSVPLKPFCSQEKNSDTVMALLKIPKAPSGWVARRVQWKNISEKTILGSLWEALTSEKSQDSDLCRMNHSVHFTVDFKLLTQLFFEDSSKKKENVDSQPCGSKDFDLSRRHSLQNKSRCSVISVLDTKRRQNIEICLKGLGLLDNISPLIETVVKLIPFRRLKNDQPQTKDIHCLTAENLQLVLSLYPTKQEEELLKNIPKTNGATLMLGKAETFLLQLLNIDHFQERAECCLIHLTLVEDIQALLSSFNVLCDVVSKISHTLTKGVFHSILRFLLCAGNYLNQGCQKGACRGFSLESLGQIKKIKSIDNSTTLIQVLAQAIEDQCPSMWDELKVTFATDHNVSESWLKSTHNTLSVMKSQMELIQTQLSKMNHDSVFISVFSDFKNGAEVLLTNLEKAYGQATTLLIRLAVLCGERDQTTATGFNIIRHLTFFYKDLCQSHVECLKSKAPKRTGRKVLETVASQEGEETTLTKSSSHGYGLKKDNKSDLTTSQDSTASSLKIGHSSTSLEENPSQTSGRDGYVENNPSIESLDCSKEENALCESSNFNSDVCLPCSASCFVKDVSREKVFPGRISTWKVAKDNVSEGIILAGKNLSEKSSSTSITDMLNILNHHEIPNSRIVHSPHTLDDQKESILRKNSSCEQSRAVDVTPHRSSPGATRKSVQVSLEAPRKEVKSPNKVSRFVLNRLMNSMTVDKSTSKKNQTLRDILRSQETFPLQKSDEVNKPICAKEKSERQSKMGCTKESNVLNSSLTPRLENSPSTTSLLTTVGELKIRRPTEDVSYPYRRLHYFTKKPSSCLVKAPMTSCPQNPCTKPRKCFLEKFYAGSATSSHLLRFTEPLPGHGQSILHPNRL